MPSAPQFATSPTLDRVLAGELCSGCGLCAALGGEAVALASASPGYLRPRQYGSFASQTEAAVATVCPGATVAPWPDDAHPVWGPLGTVATGAATDAKVQHAASSGGMLSALLIHALTTRQVDAVLQISADPANPIGNRVVISTTAEDVLSAAGSRYAPSAPLLPVTALLDDPRRFAFVGKPCDVSALRQYALIEPRVDARFPLKLAFFCGGIPSEAGIEELLGGMGTDRAAVTAFRYRGNGWPGQARATLADGGTRDMSYARSWGGYLSKHVQFRCKICPDAVGGVADIACADAWYGGESGYPAFDEAEGRSLVIARTAVGEALLASARDAGAVTTEPLPVAQIALMQPSQLRRKALLAARYAALAVTGQPRPRVRGLQLGRAARLARRGEAVRNFLGTIRRVASGRKAGR